jgi:hypothetical protein
MDRETMLALPLEELRALAPKTVVWAPGGTRRHAALKGIPSASYVEWAWEQHFRCVAQFFKLGVQTLFVPTLGPPQAREVGPYREQLAKGLGRLCGEIGLEAHARMNVRVRFYGQTHIPGLAEQCAWAEAATSGAGPQTLWYSIVVEHNDEALWDAIRAAIDGRAVSLEEAVRAFYGEPVAPVDVFIGFGKPRAVYLMPPLLGEHADLYWTAFPSYMLSEAHLREIFWDHKFGRATWSADKSQRYENVTALDLSQRYQEPLILGVGQRFGPFWHPRFPGAD